MRSLRSIRTSVTTASHADHTNQNAAMLCTIKDFLETKRNNVILNVGRSYCDALFFYGTVQIYGESISGYIVYDLDGYDEESDSFRLMLRVIPLESIHEDGEILDADGSPISFETGIESGIVFQDELSWYVQSMEIEAMQSGTNSNAPVYHFDNQFITGSRIDNPDKPSDAYTLYEHPYGFRVSLEIVEQFEFTLEKVSIGIHYEER